MKMAEWHPLIPRCKKGILQKKKKKKKIQTNKNSASDQSPNYFTGHTSVFPDNEKKKKKKKQKKKEITQTDIPKLTNGLIQCLFLVSTKHTNKQSCLTR